MEIYNKEMGPMKIILKPLKFTHNKRRLAKCWRIGNRWSYEVMPSISRNRDLDKWRFSGKGWGQWKSPLEHLENPNPGSGFRGPVNILGLGLLQDAFVVSLVAIVGMDGEGKHILPLVKDGNLGHFIRHLGLLQEDEIHLQKIRNFEILGKWLGLFVGRGR